jgi:hypothetical protein
MTLAAGGLAPVSITGIITAFATVITALGGLILAIAVLLPLLRETRNVHKIVNQQRTDMMRYQRALLALLKAHGIEPPVDQSLEPEPPAVTPPG